MILRHRPSEGEREGGGERRDKEKTCMQSHGRLDELTLLTLMSPCMSALGVFPQRDVIRHSRKNRQAVLHTAAWW